MVYRQTPRGVDSEARPFTSAPGVHPEALQFLRFGDGSCSPASGSGGRQPVKHARLVQHHR